MGRLKKPGKKITYNTRLRPEHVEWLREQKNAAAVLEVLIGFGMRLGKIFNIDKFKKVYGGCA